MVGMGDFIMNECSVTTLTLKMVKMVNFHYVYLTTV
jgi:hypothetical protein